MRKGGMHEDVYRDPGASLYRQTIQLVQYKSSSAQSAIYVMTQVAQVAQVAHVAQSPAGAVTCPLQRERENTIKRWNLWSVERFCKLFQRIIDESLFLVVLKRVILIPLIRSPPLRDLALYRAYRS